MKTKDELKKIKYLIVDVDGTMTDGSIYYDEHGNELKRFNTKDAAGYFNAHVAGIKFLVLTGRKCAATERRMQEMKIDYIVQGCMDKVGYIRQFMSDNSITKEEIGYIGDDLNDLEGMKLCGFVGCPEDACKEVKRIADYKSPIKGGYGAVRDVVEYMLTERGEWEDAYKEAYSIGV